MTDNVTSATRSRIMASVRSKDTAPELTVRRIVHRLGFRYRLHVRDLPGTPDIVLPRHRKVIEVRGCFWHGHGCGGCRVPSTRRAYWLAKIRRNAERDRENAREIRRLGWKMLVIWECQIRNEKRLARAIQWFLADTKSKSLGNTLSASLHGCDR